MRLSSLSWIQVKLEIVKCSYLQHDVDDDADPHKDDNDRHDLNGQEK